MIRKNSLFCKLSRIRKSSASLFQICMEKYLGSTSADTSKNIFLRLAQYNLYQTIDARTALARKIVSNKISNQIHLIRSHRWESPDLSIHEDIKQLEALQNGTKSAESTNELMGFEGKASNIYFQDYGKCSNAAASFPVGTAARPEILSM